MPHDICLLILVLSPCVLAEHSVLERAKEIGSSFKLLHPYEADAELVEPWPDTKEEDSVADAYWDLEDKLFFSKEKRDIAAGTNFWSTHVPWTCSRPETSVALWVCCDLLYVAGVEELLGVFIELDDALPGSGRVPWLTGLKRDEVNPAMSHHSHLSPVQPLAGPSKAVKALIPGTGTARPGELAAQQQQRRRRGRAGRHGVLQHGCLPVGFPGCHGPGSTAGAAQ